VAGGVVILVDVSGSMGQRGKDGPKIESLRRALEDIWHEIRGAALYAFADRVTALEGPSQLPPPCGGTMLHDALERVAMDRPAQVIVITDGRPNSMLEALVAADLIPGTIDTVYIGPEDDREAIEFLRELSQRGGGKSWVNDLSKVGSLISPLREALGLPAPIAL
jgi:Mg-chelatase subunit ChlD